jgi:hypothetical protein
MKAIPNMVDVLGSVVATLTSAFPLTLTAIPEELDRNWNVYNVSVATATPVDVAV